ncbi:MAG: hypothetical protein JWL66_266 [Sphingomonadales bacterium]|nr:hypothetical protein [Sphingomonadales bacterium]
MGYRASVFIAAALLSACVPPGARVPAEAAPPPAKFAGPKFAGPQATARPRAPLRDPRLDHFDTIAGVKPAWEMRPVTPNAITIDGKRFHNVTTGDTGIAIARAYGIPWSRVIAANAMAEPYVIKQGQRLLLPANDVPTMEARAKAFHLNIDDILTGGEPAVPTQTFVVGPRHFAGKFDWPIAGRLVSRFGPGGSGRVNQGVDIAAPSGGTIRASADGTVAFVGDGVPGYGGLILIRHGDGWISAYGHAATARVKRGTMVKRGGSLGTVSTEAAPSLHFELRHDRKPVDPVGYLPKR